MSRPVTLAAPSRAASNDTSPVPEPISTTCAPRTPSSSSIRPTISVRMHERLPPEEAVGDARGAGSGRRRRRPAGSRRRSCRSSAWRLRRRWPGSVPGLVGRQGVAGHAAGKCTTREPRLGRRRPPISRASRPPSAASPAAPSPADRAGRRDRSAQTDQHDRMRLVVGGEVVGVGRVSSSHGRAAASIRTTSVSGSADGVHRHAGHEAAAALQHRRAVVLRRPPRRPATRAQVADDDRTSSHGRACRLRHWTPARSSIAGQQDRPHRRRRSTPLRKLRGAKRSSTCRTPGIDAAAEEVVLDPHGRERPAIRGRRPALVEPLGEGEDRRRLDAHRRGEMPGPIGGQLHLAGASRAAIVEQSHAGDAAAARPAGSPPA